MAESFSSLVRRYRMARGMSQAALARGAHLSPGYIGLIETGQRGARPGRDAVVGIAQALRLSQRERDQLLAAAGQLDGATTGPPQTEEAIQSDPLLRADQKRALIGIYRSLVSQ